MQAVQWNLSANNLFLYNMSYATLQQCLDDLERNGHLKRVTEEVDPYLEMAAIHLRVF